MYVQCVHCQTLKIVLWCAYACTVCSCTNECIIGQLCIICVVPSTVRDLTVHVNHTNVTATWSTPAKVNGELLFYKVNISTCST